jgi:hypothetical protein
LDGVGGIAGPRLWSVRIGIWDLMVRAVVAKVAMVSRVIDFILSLFVVRYQRVDAMTILQVSRRAAPRSVGCPGGLQGTSTVPTYLGRYRLSLRSGDIVYCFTS